MTPVFIGGSHFSARVSSRHDTDVLLSIHELELLLNASCSEFAL